MKKTTTKTALPLSTRVGLPQAAKALRNMQAGTPAVIVVSKDNGEVVKLRKELDLVTKERDTLMQAQLRRERVESLLRPAPQVVVTSSAVHVLNTFDATKAVTLKLPLIQRFKRWPLLA